MDGCHPLPSGSDAPAGPRVENDLYRPRDDLRERIRYPITLKHSALTRMQMQPVRSAAVLAAGFALAAAAAALAGGGRRRHAVRA